MIGVNREPGVIPVCCSTCLYRLGGFPEEFGVHSLQNSQWDRQGLTSRDCFSSSESWWLHLLSTAVDSASKRIVCAPRPPYKPALGQAEKRGDVLAGKGLDTPGKLLHSRDGA